MGAPRRDPSVGDPEDLVRGGERRQAVRHHDDPALPPGEQVPDERIGRPRIEVLGRLVDQQELRGGEQRAGEQEAAALAAMRQGSRLKVATKYTAIAREFFASKGVHVDLIKLYGSMELAPLTGLADAIVDLVSTGNTLKANHLVEVERIMDISSRLVVNQAALKLKQARLRPLIDAFAGAVTPTPA